MVLLQCSERGQNCPGARSCGRIQTEVGSGVEGSMDFVQGEFAVKILQEPFGGRRSGRRSGQRVCVTSGGQTPPRTGIAVSLQDGLRYSTTKIFLPGHIREQTR